MPEARRKRTAWMFSRGFEGIEGMRAFLGVGNLVAANSVPKAETAPKPPATLLGTETYISKLDRRRRRLKEFRSSSKRFLAFLFSQIGLSVLVIGYTIIGGLLFRAVELENEKAVKIKGREMRNNLADQFSGEIIRELRYQLSSYSSQTSRYYKPPQPPLEEINSTKGQSDSPSRVIKREVPTGGDLSAHEEHRRLTTGGWKVGRRIRERRGSVVACQEQDLANLRRWLNVIAYTLRRKTRQELHSSLRKLVKMMEHDGWNGEDSIDDVKWSWEGSILFAVTVITTIGYGHAVPKTNAGKVLTIMYALVGIPLVFLYLTNIGDYLATLFRALYSRVCRRCCEGSCVTRSDPGLRRRFSKWGHSMETISRSPSQPGTWRGRESLGGQCLDGAPGASPQQPFQLAFHTRNINRSNLCVLRPISSTTLPFDKKRIRTDNSSPGDSFVRSVGASIFCNDQAILADRFYAQENEKMSAKCKTACPNEEHIHSEAASANCQLSDNSHKDEEVSITTSHLNPLDELSYNNDTPVSPLSPIGDHDCRIMTAHHNESTQTTLNVRPGESLSYRDLYKSHITGHYLRSYRREKRHRRRLRRQEHQMKQRPHSRDQSGYSPDTHVIENPSIRIYRNRCCLEPTSKSYEIDSHSMEASSCKSNVLQMTQTVATSMLENCPKISVNSPTLTNSTVLRPREKPVTLSATISPAKSRLSVLSSLVGSSDDLTVRLSYFSDDFALLDADRKSANLSDSRPLELARKEDLSKVTVPISLSIMIMTTYILIGAIVFSIWEDSNYLKWSYFCFVTLSTIGFGDIVPGTKIDSTNPQEKLVIITLYVAIGLSVFAMCFKLMQEEVVSKCKWLAHHIAVFKRKVRKQRLVLMQKPKAAMEPVGQDPECASSVNVEAHSSDRGSLHPC